MTTVLLRKKIREGKCSYRKKVEDLQQQNNVSDVWRGLNTISGHKDPKLELKNDQEWVNDLNTLVKPALLRENLEQTGLHRHLTMWLLHYLSNRPQFEDRSWCV